MYVVQKRHKHLFPQILEREIMPNAVHSLVCMVCMEILDTDVGAVHMMY